MERKIYCVTPAQYGERLRYVTFGQQADVTLSVRH